MVELITELPLFVGVLAAMIHVLSGPDHLAAVGPLAIDKNNNSWLVGFFWGIGHTAGMLLIGVLFFHFRDFIPVDFISRQSEIIVGVILIVIGLWVYFKLANSKKTSEKHSHIHLHEDVSGDTYAHYHTHQHKIKSNHDHKHSQKQGVLAASGIGVLHGFAGVSHLISLLPTLAFSKQTGAVLYLSGFAIGTILSMILFSVILGLLGKKASKNNKNKMYFILNAIAATVAVIVGFFWIYQSL